MTIIEVSFTFYILHPILDIYIYIYIYSHTLHGSAASYT